MATAFTPPSSSASPIVAKASTPSLSAVTRARSGISSAIPMSASPVTRMSSVATRLPHAPTPSTAQPTSPMGHVPPSRRKNAPAPHGGHPPKVLDAAWHLWYHHDQSHGKQFVGWPGQSVG